MTHSKYYAFISYNHKDADIAKWLHRKLESYRLPSQIHNEIEGGEKYLRPIFRDRDELNAGILSHELRDRLEESKYLIIICSPNSANSEWVSNEVKAFIEMGRLGNIIPLIFDGIPHSYADRDAADAYEDECFPKALRQYTKEHPDLELLGVSIPEVGKEKALVRVVSRMLGVSFDTLWDRQKRLKTRNRIIRVALAIAVVCAILGAWALNQPKDVSIKVLEGGSVNASLPKIENVIVSLDLGTEMKVDTLGSVGEVSVFKNIPAKMIGREVRIMAEAAHCSLMDTSLVLKTEHDLSIYRDPKFYGYVAARLFSFDRNRPASNVKVSVAGITTETDSNGYFEVYVPIEKQASSYILECEGARLLENVIYMPSQSGAVIEVQ